MNTDSESGEAVGPTVLVVDDSLTVRMDLSEAFESAGFEVVACASGAGARAALANRSVDLIVLDVLLPDADGVELLREIRGLPGAIARTPVLFLSNEADVGDRVRGVSTGADDYVGKPYDRIQVVARARELLRLRQGDAKSFAACILVIEDSLTFRESLRAALEAAGHRTVMAENGLEGLRLAASFRPEAIIVDAGLPDIDGPTVIRRLKLDAALRGTPCLLLTAAEDAGAEVMALEAGADTFMRKTEEVEFVLARLEAILRKTGLPRAVGTVDSLYGPKRVLAVDDSKTFLHALAAEIRDEGYDVILAESGDQALDLLGAQKVDCILLDLVMPGLSGEEVCRRIKDTPHWRDTPLVMLTAREDRQSMLNALHVGADDFIPKSSDFEVIRARLRAQIRRKHFEDENRRIREELIDKEREAVEARAARDLAQTRARLLAELETANRELESFSYSVSHDLRAPLRAISGFSQAVLENAADRLEERDRGYLERVCAAVENMSHLIEDLLNLSRVTREPLNRSEVDLSELAREILERLAEAEPDREVVVEVADGVKAEADPRLIVIVLENLLNNAWKYTGKQAAARIIFGHLRQEDGEIAYFVRDNGAGFDPGHATRLFAPFHRLHLNTDFPGTGIGLATARRIVSRHGGRIWAEAAVDQGATFFFTLGTPDDSDLRDVNG